MSVDSVSRASTAANARPLNGPGAEQGNKCPEGWSFCPLPGPPLQGDSGAAENPSYVWVDQLDILGLGADTPIAIGNQSDSLHALVGGRVIELRVPYPMGFFARSIDGRIDDAVEPAGGEFSAPPGSAVA